MAQYNIPGVRTFEYTKIIGIENIEFGKNIIIDDFVLLYAKRKMRIGNCQIGSSTSLYGELSLDHIERICNILKSFRN